MYIVRRQRMLYVTGCSDSHMSCLGGAVGQRSVMALAQLPILRDGGGQHILEVEVFPIGSRVRVTNYSPFRGLRGTVLSIHMIAAALEEPFCFYLVALEGVQIKEPLWFEYNEVELFAPPHVGSQAS
jgi:hypothetical protein